MYSAYKLNKQGDNIQAIYVLLFLFGTSLFHVQFEVHKSSSLRVHSADLCVPSPGRRGPHAGYNVALPVGYFNKNLEAHKIKRFQK